MTTCDEPMEWEYIVCETDCELDAAEPVAVFKGTSEIDAVSEYMKYMGYQATVTVLPEDETLDEYAAFRCEDVRGRLIDIYTVRVIPVLHKGEN